MRDKLKKVLGIALATVCVSTAFVACGDVADYKGDALTGFDAAAPVSSNGGFAVEKGDYIYFINGQEDYTASNVYGEVVKAALMRVSKADLAAGNFTDETVKTVVPSLFVAQNYDAGIYIYDDYVYYATPTTGRSTHGVVENSYLDFKRAKLDGTEGHMNNYYFRVSDNKAAYRFVQPGVDKNNDGKKDVYCVYVDSVTEDSTTVKYLRSFNTATGENTVLAKGASDYYFDTENPENGDVYYTMGVTVSYESNITEKYNQIYRVNATATATVDGANEKYTVYNGDQAVKEYAFDGYMKKQNEKLKAEGSAEKYNLNDYATYPYVNLGTLVLDGIGKSAIEKTQFNWDKTTESTVLGEGYSYTINGYRDGGLYFTRSTVTTSGSAGESAKLYYVADAATKTEWNVVSGNEEAKLTVVAPNTTNTGSALIFKDGDTHYYVYLDSTNKNLIRANYDATKGEIVRTVMVEGISAANPYKVDKTGKFLYYYAASEGDNANGQALIRIKYDGTADNYAAMLANRPENAEYQPLKLDFVDFTTEWYKPEIFGDTVLYANAQLFGANAYNYIYAAKMGTAAEIKTANEDYKKVLDYINDAKFGSFEKLQAAMEYYFRTGETTAFESVRELYGENQAGEFDKFVEKFTASEFKTENAFIARVGDITAADAEEIKTAWVDSLMKPEVAETTEESLPDWAIALIVCGSVLIVGGVVAIMLVIYFKKKKAKQAEADATVNAYKRKKIDTTDDKSIDVYADEEKQEATETVEETAKEEVPVVEETTTEETQEVPVETEEKEE